MRLHLPKFKGILESWANDVIRELERWDIAVLKRESDMSKSVVFRDGKGMFFFFQQIKYESQEVTCSGSSVTLTDFIKAGTINFGVFVEVTEDITGATSFAVGLSGDTDSYGTGLGVSKGTKTSFADFTSGTIEIALADDDIVLTPSGGDFVAGKVVLTRYYADFQN